MMAADSLPPVAGCVELRLVGRPALRRADGEWLDLFPHEALVLGMVAVDGPTTRSDIAAKVWHGADGLSNLRQCLFRLARRAGTAPVAGRRTLALRPDVRSDVGVGFGDVGDGLLIADLFGGISLPSLPHPGKAWVGQALRQWRAARLHAVERRVAQWEAGGKMHEAAALLDCFLAADPMHEHLWQRRIEMQASLQDPGGALAIFARWNGTLRAAGRVPAPETVAARDRIEASCGSPRQFAALPARLLALPPFAGRQAEVRLMQQAWQRGAQFVLVGQAGVGKSRLLQRFLDGRSDALCIAAADGDAMHPYSTTLSWLQPCRGRWGLPEDARHRSELSRLLPDLGPAPAGAGHEALLQSALQAALLHAAAQGLSALVVDDLQFADSASLRLLLRFRAATPGLRLGFAARDEGPRSAGDPLPSLLAGHADVEVIPLGGLSTAETLELLRALRLDLPRLESRAGELAGHCGGNPWYLLDTLRDHLQRGDPDAPFRVPGGVGRWTEMQLRGLSAPARVMAWLAATAGTDFDLPLAAQLLAQPLEQAEASWRELQHAHVLQGDAFAHDIVRQAVTRDAPAATVREMHRRIAACLGARGAPPQRQAHHHAGGEQWPEAARAGEAAAAQSERLGQRKAQLAWLDLAAESYRRAGLPGDTHRVSICALGPCLDHDGAEAALARTARLESAALDPAQRSALDAQRARIALKMGDLDAVVGHARAALNTAAGTDRRHPLAISTLAIALAWRGQSAAALEVIEPAVETIGQVDDGALRQDLWSSYALVLAHDERWRQVVPVVERALDEAGRAGSFAAQADMHNSLAVACANLGQGGVSVEHARRSRDLSARMDAPEFERVASMNLARSLAACGQYAEAIGIVQALLRSSAADPDPDLYLSTAENTLAEMWLLTGCTDRCRDLLVADPVCTK